VAAISAFGPGHLPFGSGERWAPAGWRGCRAESSAPEHADDASVALRTAFDFIMNRQSASALLAFALACVPQPCWLMWLCHEIKVLVAVSYYRLGGCGAQRVTFSPSDS